LSSLINNIIIISCILIGYGCASNAIDYEKKADQCVEAVLNVKVAKFDKENQRLFIVSATVDAQDIADHIKELQSCFDNRKWSTNWSLSLFSDEKYAGYKDDPEIIPYHEDNSWAKGYKAEYDRRTSTLISYPAFEPKQLLP
jgi:hypothetical protein